MSKEDKPQAKGGRRRQKPDAAKQSVSPNSLANLRPWKSGESGNPIGKARSTVEVTQLARAKTPDMIERLYSIAMNEFGDVPFRDRVSAANAICDRGLGKPAIGIFHGSGASSPMEQTEDGSPVSALLARARGTPDERALGELRAEIQRIESKLAQDRQEQEKHLRDASERLSRGEEVEGITQLLLRARAANAERDAAAKAAPKRLECKADFIADSTGRVTAAPASTGESAAPTPAPAAVREPAPAAAALPPAPKAPPFQVESETTEPPPPPKPAAKPAHPGMNIPGFSEFLSERAASQADAERAKKVEAARAQGQCQIPPSEAFPPDPREGPEIVNFTRIPGGTRKQARPTSANPVTEHAVYFPISSAIFASRPMLSLARAVSSLSEALLSDPNEFGLELASSRIIIRSKDCVSGHPILRKSQDG